MLSEYIQNIKGRKGIACMAHAVVGFPSRDQWRAYARAAVAGGADIVEVQVPFSDPLADGPAIQEANTRALQEVQSLEDVLSEIALLKEEISVPVVVMSYANPVYRFGASAFCQTLASCGVSGVLVPDMNIDEEGRERFWEQVRTAGLAAIQVVSPQTTEERMLALARMADGFVYCTARMGVTGVREQDMDIGEYLSRVRSAFSHLPCAVGFGICRREQVRQIEGEAEMFIVGSAFIEAWKEGGEKEGFARVSALVSRLLGDSATDG